MMTYMRSYQLAMLYVSLIISEQHLRPDHSLLNKALHVFHSSMILPTKEDKFFKFVVPLQ